MTGVIWPDLFARLTLNTLQLNLFRDWEDHIILLLSHNQRET